jgi:hypothetical protein
VKDEFLKRLPSTAKEERALVEAAFGIPGGIRQKKQEIFADARLSDAGKVEDVRKMATGTPLQHLRQIRQRAANMAADTRNMRAALKPKEVDRTDIVAEMQRKELRDYLRSMPDGKKVGAAMENPEIAEAAFHAHPMLSGLSGAQLEVIREGYLERQFGPQLREIKAREEVVEVLDAALEVAASQFLKETGLSEESLELKDN